MLVAKGDVHPVGAPCPPKPRKRGSCSGAGFGKWPPSYRRIGCGPHVVLLTRRQNNRNARISEQDAYVSGSFFALRLTRFTNCRTAAEVSPKRDARVSGTFGCVL